MKTRRFDHFFKQNQWFFAKKSSVLLVGCLYPCAKIRETTSIGFFIFLLKMNYTSLFPRCLLCIALAVLFANCQSEKPQPSTTAAPPELEQLLAAADTLNAETLAAEARKLPGTWADTFFQQRHWALIQRQDGPGINVAASAYEKIRPGNEAAGAFIHFSRGCAYQFAARLDSADICYKLAQDWYQQTGDKEYLIQVLDCRATNSDLRGKFDEAIALKYQILDLVSDEQRRMYMKTAIAYTHIAKGDSTIQMELLETPLRYFEQARDTFTYTWVLTAQANAFRLKEDYAKSIECHQKALLLRRKIGKMAHLPENLVGIAKSLNDLGQWQSALDTAKVAEQILAPLNAKQGIAACQIIAGEALFHLNRLPEADAVLLQNFEDARARKRYLVAMKATLLLSKSKKQQGKPAEALDFQTQHLAFKDSVYSQEKEKIIQEMAAKYETREKEQELKNLKRETQLERQRNWWLAGSAGLIFGLVFYFSTMQNRRRQQLLENEKFIMHREKQFVEALAQRKTTELEQSKNELQSTQVELNQTIQLLETKNKFIEELNMRTAHDTQAAPSESPAPALQATKQAAELRRMKILTPEDWQQFQHRFEQRFPYFLENMRQKLPVITAAETRLFLLVKLQFTNQEISEALGISIESVWKSRYRLIKKLDLAPGSLDSFVENFQYG